MEAFVKMRDRRNTNLSTSSASSSDSALIGAVCPSHNEKQMSSPPPHSLTLSTSITKENISRPHARSRFVLALQLCSVLCAVIVLWRIAFNESFKPVNIRISGSDISYAIEVSGRDGVFPDEPSVLTVTDTGGHSRWTVHIPHNYSFPLRSGHTQQICKEGELSRGSISQQSRLVKTKAWRRKSSYYSTDKTFLDVEEAENIGVLPQSSNQDTSKVCDKSITLALDAEDASFGKSLLMLWLSYGLARREGRAFFIDDTRWPYGQYTTFFAPAPSPNCIRPPPHRIVPCPRSANHLLVGSATLPWTFGTSFEEEYTQRRKTGFEKSRRIFDLLRIGYDDLFRMTGEHALYSASRIARFKEEAYQHDGSVIGIHLRRGDLHPFEHQFSQDYLPLERYGTAARKLLRSQLQMSLPGRGANANDFQAILEYRHLPLLLASDDPEMFNSAELMGSATPFVMQKAQERIQLATKSTLDLAASAEPVREPGSAYLKHVTENSGWEGGFYSALFFSLGKRKSNSGDSTTERQSRSSSPSTENEDEQSSEEAKQLRELVGRAYLLDLAVLGASDGVVCAISSATCRVLAVMLGWDAVNEGRWVNIDDDNPVWSWDGRR